MDSASVTALGKRSYLHVQTSSLSCQPLYSTNSQVRNCQLYQRNPIKKYMDIEVEVLDKHKSTYVTLHKKECVKVDMQNDMHLRILDCVPDVEP